MATLIFYTIYRITAGNHHYIGSTKDFKQRSLSHKLCCKNGNPLPVYQKMREVGIDNCTIMPIELVKGENNKNALIREEFWRRQYMNILNVRQAMVTAEELKERKKISNAKTNAVWAPRRNLNYIICPCGGEYQSHCKTAHVRGKRHAEFLIPPLLSD